MSFFIPSLDILKKPENSRINPSRWKALQNLGRLLKGALDPFARLTLGLSSLADPEVSRKYPYGRLSREVEHRNPFTVIVTPVVQGKEERRFEGPEEREARQEEVLGRESTQQFQFPGNLRAKGEACRGMGPLKWITFAGGIGLLGVTCVTPFLTLFSGGVSTQEFGAVMRNTVEMGLRIILLLLPPCVLYYLFDKLVQEKVFRYTGNFANGVLQSLEASIRRGYQALKAKAPVSDKDDTSRSVAEQVRITISLAEVILGHLTALFTGLGEKGEAFIKTVSSIFVLMATQHGQRLAKICKILAISDLQQVAKGIASAEMERLLLGLITDLDFEGARKSAPNSTIITVAEANTNAPRQQVRDLMELVEILKKRPDEESQTAANKIEKKINQCVQTLNHLKTLREEIGSSIQQNKQVQLSNILEFQNKLAIYTAQIIALHECIYHYIQHPNFKGHPFFADFTFYIQPSNTSSAVDRSRIESVIEPVFEVFGSRTVPFDRGREILALLKEGTPIVVYPDPLVKKHHIRKKRLPLFDEDVRNLIVSALGFYALAYSSASIDFKSYARHAEELLKGMMQALSLKDGESESTRSLLAQHPSRWGTVGGLGQNSRIAHYTITFVQGSSTILLDLITSVAGLLNPVWRAIMGTINQVLRRQ